MTRFTSRKSIFFFASFATWLLLASFQSSPAQSVVFHLRNGDRLTGTIESESASHVIVASPSLGKVNVPLDEIAGREVPPGVAPAPKTPVALEPPKTNAPPVAAAKPAPEKPAPALAPATAKAAPATNEFKIAPSAWHQFWTNWHGELQLGANLGYSSKNRQTYTGLMKVTRIDGPMKNSLDYDATYGKTAGELSDNRMDGSWKIEYDLTKRFLIYNSAGAGYDEIRNIDFRFDVGPGVGYRVITLSNFVWKVETGANYQKQFYSNTGNQERYSIRLAEESMWQINPKLKFEQKLEFFPELNQLGEMRARGEINLSYLLGPHLSFTFSVVDLYDTDVPDKTSHNDLQIRSLLGVKF